MDPEPYGALLEVVPKCHGGQVYFAPTVPRQANYTWSSMDDSERLVHSKLPIEKQPKGVYCHTANQAFD